MSFWIVMNYVAWGLCALLAYLIFSDFIKVELNRAKHKKQS
jgi:hypothetical protein